MRQHHVRQYSIGRAPCGRVPPITWLFCGAVRLYWKLPRWNRRAEKAVLCSTPLKCNWASRETISPSSSLIFCSFLRWCLQYAIDTSAQLIFQAGFIWFSYYRMFYNLDVRRGEDGKSDNNSGTLADLNRKLLGPRGQK